MDTHTRKIRWFSGTAISLAMVVFFLCLSTPVHADSPIYRGLLWDAAPAVAYNSKDSQFLVVWNVFNPLFTPDKVLFYGPVMGQLIQENGGPVDKPFKILDVGVLADVAYNAQSNQYLVVAEQWFQTVGQRLTSYGAKIGGQTTLIADTRYPRVVYNSLSGEYLVAGTRFTATDVPGACNTQLYTRVVSSFGTPGTLRNVVQNEYHGNCDGEAVYDIAYAPITSITPTGRYMLAYYSFFGLKLKMLDSSGQSMPAPYDDYHYFTKKIGEPYNISTAFGYLQQEPVFFLVWGDRAPIRKDYTDWTGIWGGMVPADNDFAYTNPALIFNEVFPISMIWSHWAYPSHAMEWKPQVVFNSTAKRFVVAWRETPGDDPRDLTDKKHIRVNTVDSTIPPPQENIVVSATTGTENPKLPALASSSKSAATLIAWEDYRNILGDIYGMFFSAASRSTVNLGPPTQNKKLYWKQCSAGVYHSLCILSDGTLWAWGDNSYGQLGLGDTANRLAPTQVGAASDWVSVSAGGTYSLGIRADDTLWAWGDNSYGQLGMDDIANRHTPIRVGTASDWVSVFAGAYHSLGIRTGGTLWAWGWNRDGQLGLGDTANRPVPTRVGTASNWTSMSAEGYQSLGIRADGTLWAWGYNYSGQLGLGDTINRLVPTQVGATSDWVSVAAGDFHSMGIRADGTLWAWGWNSSGQLGLGDTINRLVPAKVGAASDWVSVAAGSQHSLSIRGDGTLWAWGDNSYGQLGLDDTINRLVPAKVGAASDWVSVAAGAFHNLSIRADGTLWVWGDNSSGQLGLGNTTDREVPTMIGFPYQVKVIPKAMPWVPLLLLGD